MVDRYRIVHRSPAGEYVEEWETLEQAMDSLLHWGRAYYIEDLETNKIYTFGEVRKMKDRKIKDEARYEFVESKEDIKTNPESFNLKVSQVGNMLSISGYASDLIEFIYANQGYEITEEELEKLSDQPMTKIKKLQDKKVSDVNPRKGESKEDFVSRFMSETKNEYPDNKQRYAVALSYWENKNKDKKVVRDMLNYEKVNQDIFKLLNANGYANKFSTFDRPNGRWIVEVSGSEEDYYGIKELLKKHFDVREGDEFERGMRIVIMIPNFYGEYKDRKSVKDDYKYKLVPKVWEEDDFSGDTIDKKSSKEFWENFWQEGMDKQKSGNRQAFLRWVESAMDYAETDLVGYIQEEVLRELRQIKVNFDVKDRKSVKDSSCEFKFKVNCADELKNLISTFTDEMYKGGIEVEVWFTPTSMSLIYFSFKDGCYMLPISITQYQCEYGVNAANNTAIKNVDKWYDVRVFDKKTVKDDEVIETFEIPHKEYTSYEDIVRINEELSKKAEAGLLLPISKDSQKIELAEPSINGIWIMWLKPNGAIDKITLC